MNLENFSSPEFDKQFTENVYKEIWIDGEYDRYGVSVSVGDNVLDLGAHVGLFSQYAIHKGANSVHAFESHEEIFSHLSVNTKETKSINVYNKKISYQDFGFKEILELVKLDNIDFCKVDIEGFEYDLILNTPDEILKKIDKWAVEFHLWGWWNNTADEFKSAFSIIEKFTKNGFSIGCEHIHKNTNLIMLYAKRIK